MNSLNKRQKKINNKKSNQQNKQKNTQKMDEQTRCQQFNYNRMIEGIIRTYNSVETQHVQEGQNYVMGMLKNDTQAVKLVFQLLAADTFDDNFKCACGNILKKYCYWLGGSGNEQQVAEQLYRVLMEGREKSRTRELLTDALSYLITTNTDLNHKLTDKLINEVNGVRDIPSIQYVMGWAQVAMACLRSLQEPQQVGEFIHALTDGFLRMAEWCLEGLGDDPAQVPDHEFEPIIRIWELFEAATQALIKEPTQEYANSLRGSFDCHPTVAHYLYAFTQQGSILSAHPSLNNCKSIIINILYLLHQTHPLPFQTAKLVLVTVVRESSREDYFQDESITDVIATCMQIIEVHLRNQWYDQFWYQYKVELIFAMFMYARTDPTEEEYLQSDMERFVDIAEAFSEAEKMATEPKGRAANLLKQMVYSWDDGRFLILKYVVMFLSHSNTPLKALKAHIQDCKDCAFLQESQRVKVDVSLMVLTLFSNILLKYIEDLKTVEGILIRNVSPLIWKTKDNLIVVRFVRVIGYYPSSFYLPFVLQTLKNNPTLKPEAVRCLERVSKNTRFAAAFPKVDTYLIELLQHVELDHVVLDNLIMYCDVFRKSEPLILAFLNKVKSTFAANINEEGVCGSKHLVIRAMNFMEKLVALQGRRKEVVESAMQMEEKAIPICFLHDNVICIEEEIMKIGSIGNNHTFTILQYLLSFPNTLSNLTPSSHLVLLTNHYLHLPSTSPNACLSLCNPLVQYFNTYNLTDFNFNLLPYLSFLLGDAVVYRALDWDEQWVMKLISLTSQVREADEVWVLFLLLHYMIVHCKPLHELLLKSSTYASVLSRVLRCNYYTKIHRKVAIMAVMMLLKHESQVSAQKKIVQFCVRLLQEQNQHYQSRSQYPIHRGNQKLNRKLLLDQSDEEEEAMSYEQKQNYQIFKNYKHWLDGVSQFENFRKEVQEMNLKAVMGEEELTEMRSVMRVQWHQDSTRNFYKIKSNIR